ncbi:hypothetical protein NQZ79_g7239 [Umbelopsis isabellina]|nr:hypothetical protein NQZ79_g7239 [Umbelopsis isabellina]
MGTKSRNAKKSMNRGRGRGRGTSGRGRGRGGRGGRGGHSGVPTSFGYATQQPTTFKHLDDLYDDFKVYGQFASDSEDDRAVNRSARHNSAKHSQKSKKPNFSSRSGMRTFNDEDNDGPAAAGLGYRAIGTSTAASLSQAKMPLGRSKYTKMMVFHKSTTLLNNDSQADSEQEIDSSTTYKPSSAPTSEGKTTALENSESSDEVEIIDANDIAEPTKKAELDELLSGLTLQDPSLVSVVSKMTRKERREQRFQELLGISDSDSDSDADDEDENEELFDNTGDFDDDIYLDADDLVVDEDELANMLDYIEHSGLQGDAQEELIAYYATLVEKLATLGIEPTGGKGGKGAKKKAVTNPTIKKSTDQNEEPTQISVEKTVELELTSDTELLDVLEESDDYVDDTEENDGFLIDEEGLAALRNYLEQDGLDSAERDELQAAYDVLCERLAKKTSLTNSEVTNQPKQDQFGNTIVAAPSKGKRVKAITSEKLSEVYLDPYSDEEIHIISTTETKLKNNLSIDESDDEDEDEDEFYEEEDEVEDYQDSEEDDAEELEADEFDELEVDVEEDEEDEESGEDYVDDTYYELEADEDNIIIDAVPPPLQRGYNAVSKFSAREARQRRMLKTEAFELDLSPQLTDKQRRKLEKKAEKQRQKEKPLSSKKTEKINEGNG